MFCKVLGTFQSTTYSFLPNLVSVIERKTAKEAAFKRHLKGLGMAQAQS